MLKKMFGLKIEKLLNKYHLLFVLISDYWILLAELDVLDLLVALILLKSMQKSSQNFTSEKSH